MAKDSAKSKRKKIAAVKEIKKTLMAHGRKLAKDIPRLKMVRLMPGHPVNEMMKIESVGLTTDHIYAVLGECGDTGEYLLMDVTEGKVLKGTFPIDRFEKVPGDWAVSGK